VDRKSYCLLGRAVGSERDPDSVVGCRVGRSCAFVARRRVDTCPGTSASSLRPDPRHAQRSCCARGDRSLRHDVCARRPGRLPRDHGSRTKARKTVRPTGTRRRRCRDFVGGSVSATGSRGLGAHTVAASLAFVALGAWPLLAADRQAQEPLLRLTASVAAAVVLLGFVAWFGAELNGSYRGLAERAAAGAEALWPLAVVVSCRRAERSR
jgi:hypothetical protein